MHVTTASPLPRVEMATVKGLNSHRAVPSDCSRGEAPRRRSSSVNSLQVRGAGSG